MLKEFHKLFQTRFPTHLCHFCTCCSLCFKRFNSFTFRSCHGIQKCYWLWPCRLAHSGVRSGCCQLCDFLALTCDETHKGDAAAVSVSAVNPPSVSRYKCVPSLSPSAAPGWWIHWWFRSPDKSPNCLCLHMQDTVCAWGEGEMCVILQGAIGLSAQFPFCSAPL